MNTSPISSHAAVRMQQRGIPPLVVEWLHRYGDETYDHHGARIVFFSKKSRHSLKRDVGDVPYRRMSDYFDCYLVESDGQVITTGRRYHHISRQS